MARVVKLSALLPEDIVIEMPGGQTFTLPGDPPLQAVLKIAALFERSAEAAASEDGDEGIGIQVLTELDEHMLGLLRMRDPEIQESPFGVFGVQQVVAAVLEAYNFGTVENDDPPTRTRTKAPADRKRSTRSSG